MTGFKIEDLIEEKGQAFQIFVKKCPKCGKEFDTLKAEQIYCSAECREQALAEFEKTERERSEMAEKQGFVSRICANPDCGRKFMPKTARQLYCSAECSKVQQPPTPEALPTPTPVEETKTKEKVCPVCGKTFVANSGRQIYCSGECYRNRYKNICKVCGKEFLAGAKGMLYCSRDCRDKLEIERICPVCGEKFVTNQKRRIYCSDRCRIATKIATKKKVCPICGKEFVAARNEQLYCSQYCANKNHKPYSSRIVLEATPVPEPPTPEVVPIPAPAPEPPQPEVVPIPVPVEKTYRIPSFNEKLALFNEWADQFFVGENLNAILIKKYVKNLFEQQKECDVSSHIFTKMLMSYCVDKGYVLNPLPLCTSSDRIRILNKVNGITYECIYVASSPVLPEPPQPEAVPTPTPVEKTKTKKNVCPICNKEFESRRVDGIYCSNACKTKAYRQRTAEYMKAAKLHKNSEYNRITFWQKITNFVRRIFKGNR